MKLWFHLQSSYFTAKNVLLRNQGKYIKIKGNKQRNKKKALRQAANFIYIYSHTNKITQVKGKQITIRKIPILYNKLYCGNCALDCVTFSFFDHNDQSHHIFLITNLLDDSF